MNMCANKAGNRLRSPRRRRSARRLARPTRPWRPLLDKSHPRAPPRPAPIPRSTRELSSATWPPRWRSCRTTSNRINGDVRRASVWRCSARRGAKHAQNISRDIYSLTNVRWRSAAEEQGSSCWSFCIDSFFFNFSLHRMTEMDSSMVLTTQFRRQFLIKSL